MSIEVADSLNVGKTDVVLDVRSRIEKESDIYDIKYPVRGGLVYCLENEKFYVIKTLVAADVNGYTIANYKVGTYEELNVGGAKYSAGSGISISVDGVISCTVEGGGSEYTAGNGISISGDNEISIKGVQHFDEPQDGFIGLYTDENGLHFAGDMLITKQELSEQLGGIDSILDNINGEVI